jgi:hypothetical protein
MHNVQLIRRRFPKHADQIIAVLTILLLLVLAIGAGLLFL